MLKEERHLFIINELKDNNVIQVSDIKDKLDVTEMTIRRDLKELEEKGILKRIHGGATRVDLLSTKEFSHNEKIKKNISEKQEIAQKIASTIEENETIFLGPGSTIELVSDYIEEKSCKLVTNSLYLFNRLRDKNFKNLILIGGSFRANTGAFVGSFATGTVRKLRFKRAFIGVNGINGDKVFAYSEDEGEIQKIALDNSQLRYIVADHTKVGREDFYSFYNLDEVNAVISDSAIDDRSVSDIEIYTKLL